MKRLGVNIDHVATLRNARNGLHPDPLAIAKQAFKFGADSITIHLREDRRHIKDLDVKKLTQTLIPINLEIAANDEMLKIAIRYKPNFVCLVPENRKEITTESGINIIKNYNIIKKIITKLNDKKIRTSLFINPNYKDIKLSHKIGSKCIELHTGRISDLIKSKKKYLFELKKIKKCAYYAKSLGLEVHAGHGIDYKTASILSNIKHIKEFNIGHFIIGESLINGIEKVIKKFKKISKK
jgi:pyridoxine 5-phosphate synthase